MPTYIHCALVDLCLGKTLVITHLNEKHWVQRTCMFYDTILFSMLDFINRKPGVPTYMYKPRIKPKALSVFE